MASAVTASVVNDQSPAMAQSAAAAQAATNAPADGTGPSPAGAGPDPAAVDTDLVRWIIGMRLSLPPRPGRPMEEVCRRAGRPASARWPARAGRP
ncbi:hypothetical protein GCM10009818_03140 [Nakamurella flavida]